MALLKTAVLFQCVSNGVTAALHWADDLIHDIQMEIDLLVCNWLEAALTGQWPFHIIDDTGGLVY